MAYEFQRLDAVTEVEEVSDGATVLMEDDGEIVRAPKGLVGGGGGYDVLLQLDFTTPGESWDGAATLTELKGSFSEALAKLQAGQYVDVRMVLLEFTGKGKKGDGEVICISCDTQYSPSFFSDTIRLVSSLNMGNVHWVDGEIQLVEY